jgi:hypothetical protein
MTDTLTTWDQRIRPFLQSAQWEASTAKRHIHKAGYAISQLIERPEWATNMQDELKSLEAALDCALKDVRTVMATYEKKPAMAEAQIKTLQAAE